MTLAHILGSSADSDIDIAAPLLTATEDAVPLANGYNVKTASKSTVKINSHLHSLLLLTIHTVLTVEK